MEMSIEDIEQWARQNNYTIVADNWWEAAQDTINKYRQLQADYENRLKVDKIAMLTELKNELTDISWNIDMYDSDLDFECCYLNDIDKIIKQKINTFRGAAMSEMSAVMHGQLKEQNKKREGTTG